MRWVRYIAAGTVLVLGSSVFAADGEFRGPGPHKQDIEVRIIALAVTYPRSSFFANDEVFVAEQELARDESRFIKLVYGFLPYQSPLSSYGLNYSVVHMVRAVRDTSCDESLWQMRTLQTQRRHSTPANEQWRYAQYAPIADLDFRQANLRCYRTTSDDYE